MGALNGFKERKKWNCLTYLGGHPSAIKSFFCGVKKENDNVIIYNAFTLEGIVFIPKQDILNLEIRRKTFKTNNDRIVMKINYDGMELELLFSALGVQSAYNKMVSEIHSNREVLKIEDVKKIESTNVIMIDKFKDYSKEKFYDKDWFMWVAFILFAPVGIYLMWKKVRFAKITRVILSLVLCYITLLQISFYTGGYNNKKNNTAVNNETKQMTEVKKEENKTATVGKSMNDMTIDEYIKSSNMSIAEVTNSLDNTGYILIRDKFNSEHSENIAAEICPILKNLQKHKDYSKVKKVGIMIMADFTDTYGKKTEAKSLSMDISKEELDKINWDNFDYKNIYKLSSDLWIHPSIKD